MSTDFTIPRSVIGLRISGSSTVARAAWTASSVGPVTEGAGMPSMLRAAEAPAGPRPGRPYDHGYAVVGGPERAADARVAPLPARPCTRHAPPRGRPPRRAAAAARVVRRARPARRGAGPPVADVRAGRAGAAVAQRPDSARRPVGARGPGPPRGVRRGRPGAVHRADRRWAGAVARGQPR